MKQNHLKFDQPLLDIQDLKTWFPIRRGVLARVKGYVRAVDGVSLKIFPGETVGLVGESGCGKSTFGRTILGLEKPIGGAIFYEGVNLTRLTYKSFKPYRRNIQIIFQDPLSSLNPKMNIIDILTEGITEFGLVTDNVKTHAIKLLKDVGLSDDALYRYPHEFSGGQRQRINIARAISLKPKFIVCDEPVSALDVSVQAQVINLLMVLRDTYQLSYLFISHDLSVVSSISHRIAVMYLGRLVEVGPTSEVIFSPKHPYTKALIDSVPQPGVYKQTRIPLKGETPSPAAPPSGCRFHPRCREAIEQCRNVEPVETKINDCQVWCHLYQ